MEKITNNETSRPWLPEYSRLSTNRNLGKKCMVLKGRRVKSLGDQLPSADAVFPGSKLPFST